MMKPIDVRPMALFGVGYGTIDYKPLNLDLTGKLVPFKAELLHLTMFETMS